VDFGLNKAMSLEYDTIKLKDEITDLRRRKKVLEEEVNKTDASCKVLEEQCNKLKTEFNVAGAVDLVKLFMANDKPESSLVSIADAVKPITDPKFLEANKKLEMKILNADMTKTLPLLEKEALRLERKLGKLKDVHSGAQAQEAGIPVHMMKSADELTTDYTGVIERKASLKADMKTDIDQALAQKVNLKAEIGRLRLKYQQVIDEEWAMKSGVRKLRLALASAQGSSDVLMQQHEHLRQTLFPSAVDKGLDTADEILGWSNYVFEDYCTVVDGCAVVQYADVPSATLPWIASKASAVMALGGPSGKIDKAVTELFDPSFLDSHTTLDESTDSAASRGAESAMLKYLLTLNRNEVHSIGFTQDQFVGFCEWLEQEYDQ